MKKHGEKFSKLKRQVITILPLVFIACFFVFQAHHAHAAWLEPIYKVLKPPFAPGSLGAVIAYIWDTMMKLVNSLVLIALVYVAFMNILRIQLDSYAVKKILPTFIMAVILANFSFLISRIVIDIGNVAISIFLLGFPSTTDPTGHSATTNQVANVFNNLIQDAPKGPKNVDLASTGATSYAAYILSYIVKQWFLIAGSILVFILSFIFLIRNYMLYFLVAIAPVAFMAMILPITKKYFQMWWSNMFKWTFMPVVSVFWLWLAGQFMYAINARETAGGTWILPLGFAGLCFYMAITSPFKIGGAVVGAWAGLGKKTWARTGGAAWKATGGAGVTAAKDYINFQYGVGKNWAKERAKKIPGISQIDRAIGKGVVTKDLYARKVAKQETLRKNANFVNYINDKGAGWLAKIEKTDPTTHGRLKAYLSDMAKEETGPNYREQYSVRDLASRQLYHKDENGVRTRTDIYKIMTDEKYRSQVEDYFGKSKSKDMANSEKRASSIAEYLASTQEIRRRYNNKRLATHLDASMKTDPSKTIEDFYINEGIYQTKDYRDLSQRAPDERLPRPKRYKQEAQEEIQAGVPQQEVLGEAEPGEEGEEEEEEENVPASSGVPMGRQQTPDERTADLSRTEELLEQILEKTGRTEEIDKKAADAIKPTGLGVGAAIVPEIDVRIKGIDPATAEQLRILQTRVAKANGAQALRLQQQQEATLQTVAQQLKSGQSPEEIEKLVAQGQSLLEGGDVEGARNIALQINPAAGPSLDLTQKGSTHE